MENLVAPSRKFWNGKKVLVTGHTGFKGAWICSWLEHLGAQVVGAALQPNTNPNLFSALKLEKRVENYFVDIRHLEAVKKVFKTSNPTITLHLAAQPLVRDSYDDPLGTYSTNIMGTANVLQAALEMSSCQTVVNVTTDKCYENREWHWGYRENEALGGHDPYSSSKACSEIVTSAYRRSFYAEAGRGLASARAGNVIGGGDWSKDRLIPDVIRAISSGLELVIRNPESIRPWQHVLEPLRGYLLLAEKLHQSPQTFGKAFNFGPDDGDVSSVDQIVGTILKAWNKPKTWTTPIAKQPHEAKILKLDSSLARAELGWIPALPITDTVAWTADWYKRFYNGADAQTLVQEQVSAYENLFQGHSENNL